MAAGAFSEPPLAAEGAERRWREAEIVAEIARTINASLDLDTILRRVYEGAKELCAADMAVIALPEAASGTMVFRYRSGVRDRASEGLRIEPGKGAGGQVLVTGRSLRIDRYDQDPRITADYLGLVRAEGIVAELVVPIQTESRMEGLLYVANREARPFTDRDEAILLRLADHAAIALRNARLFTETRQRLRYTEALLAISRLTGGTLDVVEIARRTIREMVRVLEADLGGAWIIDPGRQQITPLAGYRIPKPLLETHARTVLPEGHPLIAEMNRRKAPLYVDDSQADPRFDHPLVGLLPHKAILLLPVWVKDQMVAGFMVVWLGQPPALTAGAMRLLEVVGQQAAVAIEDSRLAEAELKLQRRKEALVGLGRELATERNLDRLLSRIAERARQLLGTHSALILLLSGDDLVVRGAAGVEEALAATGPLKVDGSLTGAVVREGDPLVCADLAEDAHWRQTPVVRRFGYRGMLAVPLRVQDRAVGVLKLLHREPRRFPAEDVEFVQTLAAHAALAIENARLFDETERRRREAESLTNVGRLISRSLDPVEVGGRMVDTLCALFSARASVVYRLDPGSQDLVLLAGAGPDVEWTRVLPRGTGTVGLAIRERRSVATADLLTDPRISLAAEDRARVERSSYRAVLAVPLLAKDVVIGALGIGDDPGRTFGPDEIRLAEAFADQAATALENARLYDEAKEARDFLRSIAENSADGIITTDIHGRVTYFSPGAEDLLGYRAGDVVGQRVEGFYPGGREEAQAVMRRLGSEGRIPNYEVRFRARDGRWVEVSASLSLLRDAGGVVGTLGIVKDITERKRAEERQGLQFAVTRVLAEASVVAEAVEKLLQAIGEALGWDVGEMWLVSPGGDELGWNGMWHSASVAGREFGAISREVVFAKGRGLPGRAWADGQPLWVPDVLTDPEFVRAAIAAREGLHAAFAFPIRSHSGVTGVMVFFSRDVRPQDPDLLRMVADISSQIGQFADRKRAEEALRESEAQLRQSQKMEAVGRLAGGVAHDFNNLLTVIMGHGDILLSNLGPADPNQPHLALIQQTAERAAGLTRQLLAFSRKQVLQPKVLDLNAVVGGLATLLRRLIGEDVELIIKPGPGLRRVKADPGQLEQVIINLSVNARDAMPEGGGLTFETRNADVDETFARAHPDAEAGAYAVLAVRDTGCGMSEEVQAHIFEPFFTTKGPSKGTGLGLSTVYGIVKQHNGYILARSAPGKGTTFEIYLPQVPSSAESTSPSAAPAKPPRGSETILLVEDEEGVRQLAAEILENNGYTVLRAANGREALEIHRRSDKAIDLLLTDVVMPQMSGRELAEALVSVGSTTKVLYMSGYTDDAIVHHGVLDPGTVLLAKPFTPAALAQKVREVLDSSTAA